MANNYFIENEDNFLLEEKIKYDPAEDGYSWSAKTQTDLGSSLLVAPDSLYM